jgi:hypothetical protein
VLPHPGVHRGRDEERAAVRERSLGEDVVGEAVRELRHRVRGEGRDHEQVGPLEVRVGIGRGRFARQREEGLGADELLGAPRRKRQNVVSRLDEEADELAGLVGRDAAGDPEQDSRHRLIVPTNSRGVEVAVLRERPERLLTFARGPRSAERRALPGAAPTDQGALSACRSRT